MQEVLKGLQGSGSGSHELPYSAEDVAQAISARLRAGRATLGCAAAALKSRVLAHRQVAAELVNLARHTAITSSLWSLRKYSFRSQRWRTHGAFGGRRATRAGN